MGRLRASNGLSVDKYIGPFYRRTLTDLNFPAISSDHSIAGEGGRGAGAAARVLE